MAPTDPRTDEAIARHADIDVTLGIYDHTDLDAMREVVNSIEWGRPVSSRCYIRPANRS